MPTNIVTPTEEFILESLHLNGDIQSLFQFAVDNGKDYSNLVISVYHLRQIGLVDVYKRKDRAGRPLLIKLHRVQIHHDLKMSLDHLDGK